VINHKINNWILASRPRTLPAALVPVLVGSAVAVNHGSFYPLLSILALLCAVLIQIGTNFTNDLYDYLKGADTEKRKGPLRVLASGMVSVKEMKYAIIIIFSLAFLTGMYLVYQTGLFILIIGVLSITAGLAYTAGPYPLAYNGLGDLFVFLFFGFAGTIGTTYLHILEISDVAILASVPVGALVTNILVVNNYRDIEEDKTAGKITLAVILGRRLTRIQYVLLMAISLLTPFVLFYAYNFGYWIFLPYITLPVVVKLVGMIFSLEGKNLNNTLELTAKFSAIYGILFSAGIII
jgi:1,4-dihydroxy-2-naphthoate polyprenyltransferase